MQNRNGGITKKNEVEKIGASRSKTSRSAKLDEVNKNDGKKLKRGDKV